MRVSGVRCETELDPRRTSPPVVGSTGKPCNTADARPPGQPKGSGQISPDSSLLPPHWALSQPRRLRLDCGAICRARDHVHYSHRLLAVDIGGVRTNFRMPDILSVGLGGGTRIRVDPAGGEIGIGPDSVGFRLLEDSHVFGGSVLTASDIAVKSGHASFGDAGRVPPLPAGALDDILRRFRRTF